MSRSYSSSSTSSSRSDCCMKALVLVFKLILGGLVIAKLVFTIIDLLHLIKMKQDYIERNGSLDYYISLLFLGFAILNLLALVLLIVLERACGLLWNLAYMVVNLAWEVHVKTRAGEYGDYVHTVGFVFHVVLCILLGCYIILIWCK